MIIPLIVFLVSSTTHCQNHTLPYLPFQSQPPPESGQTPAANPNSNQHSYPTVKSIKLNSSQIFPEESGKESGSCFGTDILKVQQHQELTVVGSQPFLLFFNTKAIYMYYHSQQYQGQIANSVVINKLIESQRDEDGLHKIVLPLDMKCTYISSPYLKMVASVHVDFLDGVHEQHQFNFMLICASKETNEDFMQVYKPCYIFFWIIINLVLQIYHAYPRNNNHYTLYLLFLLSSFFINDQLLGYIVSLSFFMVVVLMERKNATLNAKVFSLYLTFFGLAVTLIILAYSTQSDGSDWNVLWIILQNCVQLHIVMFLTLRLIKLSRFRFVFWYFLAVSMFAVFYEGNNNIFFTLSFKNPLDLTCLSVDLFFPIMMLPIGNYFTSITNWMHRIIGLALGVSALLPLHWAIVVMTSVIVCIEAYEIRNRSLEVIKHTY